MFSDKRLSRISNTTISVSNKYNIDTTIFANDDVPVETAAVDELVKLLDLQDTIDRYYKVSPESFNDYPEIKKVILTPDFHKASGIPVGTVIATKGFIIPQAIGNDVNCGMRLQSTSLTIDQVKSNLDKLEKTFRHIFFEGGRNIPMTRNQRYALFTDGLIGLANATPKDMTDGLWSDFRSNNLEKINNRGSFHASETVGLDDFMGPDRPTRDSQIGSIGGGNHFVEIQFVKEIFDHAAAKAYGLKKNAVVVMVHTGSVSIGHICGTVSKENLKKHYPAGHKHPTNGIFVLPDGEKCKAQSEKFYNMLHNAANFAFANRLFLSLMAADGLKKVCGDTEYNLIYDSPHNFLWKEKIGEELLNIHRKGACPARGVFSSNDPELRYYGEPVLVPGSMGASSFVLSGHGNNDSLNSASHGAGRSLSRGSSLKGHEKEFEQFMKDFRIVTPVDFGRMDIRMRKDIMEKKLNELRQEAPYAYKGIGPVVKTLEGANMAHIVAELKSILTIKG